MEEELKELHHEAVPGYRKVFFIVLTIAVIYLTVIFVNTF